MNWRNLRWPVVITTMAVALGALFGGSYLLVHRTVKEPLALLYSQSPAVESYTIQENSGKYAITLKLKQIDDLAATYAELADATAQLLPETSFSIKVEDGRTPALTETFRRINLYVEEAVMTGRFADMARRIEADAAAAGQEARMSVDSERVYVQLWDDDGYLYSVTERPAAQTTLTAGAEEGGTNW